MNEYEPSGQVQYLWVSGARDNWYSIGIIHSVLLHEVSLLPQRVLCRLNSGPLSGSCIARILQGVGRTHYLCPWVARCPLGPFQPLGVRYTKLWDSPPNSVRSVISLMPVRSWVLGLISFNLHVNRSISSIFSNLDYES